MPSIGKHCIPVLSVRAASELRPGNSLIVGSASDFVFACPALLPLLVILPTRTKWLPEMNPFLKEERERRAISSLMEYLRQNTYQQQ